MANQSEGGNKEKAGRSHRILSETVLSWNVTSSRSAKFSRSIFSTRLKIFNSKSIYVQIEERKSPLQSKSFEASMKNSTESNK
jgi:hypothetical protein